MVLSPNSKTLVEFYKKVFEKNPDWVSGGYHGFMVGQSFFLVGPHDKLGGKNTNPDRVMLNFETADVEVEFDRIEKLGAEVVARPYHPGEDPNMTIATFADPDRNYFQLASPMK